MTNETTRIYAIRLVGSEASSTPHRLIRATSKAEARNAAQIPLTVKVATQEEIIAAIQGGMSIEEPKAYATAIAGESAAAQ